MKVHRSSKSTFTPAQLNHGDQLHYQGSDGRVRVIEAVSSEAWVSERNYPQLGSWVLGDISVYAFSATLKVDGEEVVIHREVGNQNSFYEPLEVAALHIWLDAVKCAFDTHYDHHTHAGGFMVEKDFLGGVVCMPPSDLRLAVQDRDRSICPEPILPWFGNSPWAPDIRQCYGGEDCWMGPYAGGFAHGGLDINMPAGTELHAPFDLYLQYYHKHLEAGFGNNAWNGFRTWDGESTWRLITSHIVDDLVEEHRPLKVGTPYATGAGTSVGLHQHTHFTFQVTEQRGSYWLDPWILFWQMGRDGKATLP